MKRNITIIVATLVVCLYVFSAYLSYTNSDLNDDSINATIDNEQESYEENNSDIIGVWTVNYTSGETAFMRCFNERGEYFNIDFHYKSFDTGDIYEVECFKGDYYETDDNEIVISVYDEEILCPYSVDDDVLILNNVVINYRSSKFYRRDYHTSISNSLIGSWKTYGEIPLRHQIDNLITISYGFEFYNDGSFKFDGSQGYYKMIYDGKGVILYYKDNEAIYNLYYLADGLILLESSINGSILLECND